MKTDHTVHKMMLVLLGVVLTCCAASDLVFQAVPGYQISVESNSSGIQWAPESYFVCAGFNPADSRGLLLNTPFCQFTTRGNQHDSQGNPVPFGMSIRAAYKCEIEITSNTYSSVRQKKQSQSEEVGAKFKIGGFGIGGGDKESSTEEELRTHYESLTEAYTKCIFTEISLNLNKGSMPPLNPEVRESFLALPKICKTAEDWQQYRDWASGKLAVTVACPVGGELIQHYFTSNDYFSKKTTDDSEWNAEVSFSLGAFGASAGGGQKFSEEELEQWRSLTKATRIYSEGCDPPVSFLNESLYEPWIQSCSKDPSKRVGLGCVWMPTYDFMALYNDSEVQDRLANLKQESLLMLQSPGCPDVFSLNYNASAFVDDGSCVYEQHYITELQWAPQWAKNFGVMSFNCSDPAQSTTLYEFKGRNPATNGSLAVSVNYKSDQTADSSEFAVNVVHARSANLIVGRSFWQQDVCRDPEPTPPCGALPYATLIASEDGSFLGGCSADPNTLKSTCPIDNLVPGSSVKLTLNMPAGCLLSSVYAYLEEVI